MAVVLAAAYLHDIGIKQAEERYQSTDSHYQEELGPPIAKGLLEKIGAPAQLIEEVCDIVGHHHHPRQNETANFKALYDADLLVNLEEMIRETPINKEVLEKRISASFLTPTGTNVARDVLLREKL
jgi:HD superfamily phosphodiesterase